MVLDVSTAELVQTQLPCVVDMKRNHMVKVKNTRGALVSGVNFDVEFDGERAFKIESSDGSYFVDDVPFDVKQVKVRAYDEQHDKEILFEPDVISSEIVFRKAPTAGITLDSLASIWLKIRPNFLNKLSMTLVVLGATLASSPWWVYPLYDALGYVDPNIQPPNDWLSFGMICMGVALGVLVNWNSIKPSKSLSSEDAANR